LALTPWTSFIHNLWAYCSWSGSPYLKSLSSPVCNHDCYNVSAETIDLINCYQIRTSFTATAIPNMDSFNKQMQNVLNLQARLYIKQNKVIVDKKSIDWMYETSRTFLLFLERSKNRAIADLLWPIEESDRVEHIMKLLQKQIRYLKKIKQYSMNSL
jgi:hypothetical protein